MSDDATARRMNDDATARGSVAVIGVGHSRTGPPRTEVSLQELIFEGASAALADAGITRDGIDSVVISASDLVDGRGIASMSSAPAAGAYMKHETRTTNDGLFALVLAAIEILAGRSHVALAIAWNKMSEVEWAGASPTAAEPFFARPVGLDEHVALGISAAALLARDPEARTLADRALARNLDNAVAKGLHIAAASARDDASELACWPLRTSDLPRDSDGAYGIVLTTESAARASRHPYVLLRGFGWIAGRLIGDRGQIDDTGLAQAARRAYDMAGVNVLDDIDMIELVARSSFEEITMLEGLVRPLAGDARTLLRDGATARGGTLPVNPSGGASGHYLRQAAGLAAAGEVVRQLMQRAGTTQVKRAKRGVAHGQSGYAAQTNVVAVFEAP
jgi:acetyl-CoA acetyltransferase